MSEQLTPRKGDKVRVTYEGRYENGMIWVGDDTGWVGVTKDAKAEVLERADDPGYTARTDQSADWHVEGRRNGGPGSDWTVNATHVPTGQSWLSLQAHSYRAGRAECVKAIKDQIERKRAWVAMLTIAGQTVALTQPPEFDWKTVDPC